MNNDIDWPSVRKRIEIAIRRTDETLAPPSRRASQILKERARALAVPLKDTDPQAASMQLLAITLRDSRYLIESRFVREVVKEAVVTPLPKAPPHLLGIMKGRGTLIPVFDLLTALGSLGALQNPARLLVLGVSSANLAIAVESVEPPTTVPRDTIADASAGSDSSSPILLGLTATADPILDGEALLEVPAFHLQ